MSASGMWEKNIRLEDDAVPQMSRSSTIVNRIAGTPNFLWRLNGRDLPTFAVPVALFGVFGALSPSLTTNTSPDLLQVLSRFPLAFFWIWAYLCVFQLSNQRLPDAILEDSINKPSRPIPSGLITAEQARQLLLALIPPFIGLSYYLGVGEATLLLLIMTWMYSDLKQADSDFISRNANIAIAFSFCNYGTLFIACGPGHSVTNNGLIWTGLISVIIFTSMQVQDIEDIEGDRAKGRCSLPVVFGEQVARWTVIVPVTCWSLFCPWYLSVPALGWVLTLVVGGMVVSGNLFLQGTANAKKTYKMWALWLIVLFSLPSLSSPVAFTQLMSG